MLFKLMPIVFYEKIVGCTEAKNSVSAVQDSGEGHLSALNFAKLQKFAKSFLAMIKEVKLNKITQKTRVQKSRDTVPLN